MHKDTRWRQRFENFEKAYHLLERTVAIANPTEAERGGLIHFFETAFELTWKTLKDYLEAEGFVANSPRDTLKQAFQNGLLTDGTQWMEMLDDRNLTAHTYDDATSKKVERLIKEKYFPLFRAAYHALQSKL